MRIDEIIQLLKGTTDFLEKVDGLAQKIGRQQRAESVLYCGSCKTANGYDDREQCISCGRFTRQQTGYPDKGHYFESVDAWHSNYPCMCCKKVW